jgi:hypothetical protein
MLPTLNSARCSHSCTINTQTKYIYNKKNIETAQRIATKDRGGKGIVAIVSA